MAEFITPVIFGVICILIGVLNTKGNISTLHSYHRKRVAEENRIPFGRCVGLATIICGAALIVFGIFSALTFFTENRFYTILGSILLISAFIVGMILCFYALKKYNGGIF